MILILPLSEKEISLSGIFLPKTHA